MKTISIYQSGKLIKKFTCKFIDITKNALVFIGVAPIKVESHDIQIAHYGKKTYHFNFEDRTGEIILPDEPEIEIKVSW